MLTRLLRVEAVTIGLFLACAILFVAMNAIAALFLSPGPLSMEGAALSFGIFVVTGVLPATLFFAPIYTLLNVRGVPGLFVAGVIGALPGVGMVIAHPEFTYPGSVGVIAGTLVALSTHVVMMRRR
jgi:hypothetical protein